MRAFIILCFFIVVRADTTVQSVSSYGLQNCYCNVCDPTKSIGKIYDMMDLATLSVLSNSSKLETSFQRTSMYVKL